MILTEVGEIGVHIGDRTHVLRPSLHAMSQLGTPAEIVSVFVSVMGDVSDERGQRLQLQDALSVIYACAGDDDLSGLFGAVEMRKTGPGVIYRPGIAPTEHILPLARALLRHGIVGALPAEKREGDGKYSNEFDARALVAVGMAHLAMSEREAWAMTMTGLVGALRSKFPPPPSNEPGANAPSKEELEAAMEWADRVDQKRRKRTLH